MLEFDGNYKNSDRPLNLYITYLPRKQRIEYGAKCDKYNFGIFVDEISTLMWCIHIHVYNYMGGQHVNLLIGTTFGACIQLSCFLAK